MYTIFHTVDQLGGTYVDRDLRPSPIIAGHAKTDIGAARQITRPGSYALDEHGDRYTTARDANGHLCLAGPYAHD